MIEVSDVLYEDIFEDAKTLLGLNYISDIRFISKVQVNLFYDFAKDIGYPESQLEAFRNYANIQ